MQQFADSSAVVDSEGLVCDKKAEMGSRKEKTPAVSLASSYRENQYYLTNIIR